MCSQVLLKWIQVFLNIKDIEQKEFSIVLKQTLLKLLYQNENCQSMEKDIFQQQLDSSILIILRGLMAIIDRNSNEQEIENLIKFIIMVGSNQEIIQQVNEQFSINEKEEFNNIIQTTDNQKQKLQLSKFELYQIVEQLEQQLEQSKQYILQLKNIIIELEHQNEQIQQENQDNSLNLQKEIQELQNQVDNYIQEKELKNHFENLLIQFNDKKQENQQLFALIQRQNEVIKEQETELNEIRSIRKNQYQQQQVDENKSSILQQLENKLQLCFEKINEMNQTIQMQRTELVKIEIQKSLQEQKYNEIIQIKDQQISKYINDIETLKQQIQQLNYDTSTRSKNESTHTISSKHNLAQELDEQCLGQELKNSTLKTELEQLKIQLEVEKKIYQHNINQLTIQLENERCEKETILFQLRDQQYYYQQNIDPNIRYQTEFQNQRQQQTTKLNNQNHLLIQIIDNLRNFISK